MRPNSPAALRALELGVLCQFAVRFNAYRQTTLSDFMRLASATQQVGQLKLYFNAYNECVGYVMWALLTPDVEQKFIADKRHSLAEWEYSDGTSAWILDMAVAGNSLIYVMEDLRDVVFENHEHITYIRRKGARSICKRVSRQDRSRFIREGRRVRTEGAQ